MVNRGVGWIVLVQAKANIRRQRPPDSARNPQLCIGNHGPKQGDAKMRIAAWRDKELIGERKGVTL